MAEVAPEKPDFTELTDEEYEEILHQLENSPRRLVDDIFEHCLSPEDLQTAIILVEDHEGKEHNLHVRFNENRGWYAPSYFHKIEYIFNRKYGICPPRKVVYRSKGDGKGEPHISKERLKRFKKSDPQAKGKRFIDHWQLLNKYVSIRTPYGRGIKGYPLTAITENLQKMLLGLIDGVDPHEFQYDQLSLDEQRLFDKTLKTLDCTLEKELQPSEMRRYTILKGEVVAGNDNPDMIEELKFLARKLRHKLSPQEYFQIVNKHF